MSAPSPKCNERIVLCEACGSEGRVLRGQYEDERDYGPCPYCEGTGGEIIETQPIEMVDLDKMSGTNPRCPYRKKPCGNPMPDICNAPVCVMRRSIQQLMSRAAS